MRSCVCCEAVAEDLDHLVTRSSLQEGPQGSTFLGQRWQRWVSPEQSPLFLPPLLPFFLLPSLLCSLFPLPSFFPFLPSFLCSHLRGTIIVRLIRLLGSQTLKLLVSSVLSPVTVLPLLPDFLFPFASSICLSHSVSHICVRCQNSTLVQGSYKLSMLMN